MSIESAPCPKDLYLLLYPEDWRKYLCIETGIHVDKGQLLMRGKADKHLPVHASTSGLIADICEHPIPSHHQRFLPHIHLKADGLNRWPDKQAESCAPEALEQSAEDLIATIHAKGIAGLGGAGFASSSKLNAALKHGVDSLIINGVECEPGVSCDEAVMLAHPDEILKAAELLLTILNLDQCTLAIAEDKPEALDRFRKQIGARNLTDKITLTPIKANYPNGSERQLIEIITGRKLAQNTYAAQAGLVCLNVSTLFAIYEATFLNIPLIERVITLTTKNHSKNVRVCLGTPAQDLFAESATSTIRRGGPLSGHIQSARACVQKGTTSLQLLGSVERKPAQACIRCDKCSDVCPEKLLPQQLLWHAIPLNSEKLAHLSLNACLECGLCQDVCPSHIPLNPIFRDAKHRIAEARLNAQHAQKAKQRVDARHARLARAEDSAETRRAKRMSRLKQHRRAGG